MEPTTQKLMMSSNSSQSAITRTYFIAASTSTSPYIKVFKWIEGDSSVTVLSDPAVIPTTGTRGVTFHPTGEALVVGASSGSPGVWAWEFSSSGFGSAITAPSGATNRNFPIFTPDGQDFINRVSSTPYIKAWPFSLSTGFGTIYSGPSTALPSTGSNGYSIRTTSTGDVVLFSGFASPYIHGYDYTPGTGFGSKWADPSTLAASQSYSCTTNDHAVVMTGGGSPNIHAWDISGGSFGSKYSTPTFSLTSSTAGVGFSPNGQYLLVRDSISSKFISWNNSTGFGSVVDTESRYSSLTYSPIVLQPGTSTNRYWHFSVRSSLDALVIMECEPDNGTFIGQDIVISTGLSGFSTGGIGLAATYFDS
jgi:hypothetical protein